MPSFLSPSFSCIDASIDQYLSAQINGGSIDSYQIIAKKNSDNTVLWDSTKTTLATRLGDKDTLKIKIIGNTITYHGDIKWILTYWNGVESVTSTEVIFTNMSTPILTTNTPTVMGNKQFDFTATYAQAENIQNMRYKYTLYGVKRVINCGHVGDVITGTSINCGHVGDVINGMHINCGYI